MDCFHLTLSAAQTAETTTFLLQTIFLPRFRPGQDWGRLHLAARASSHSNSLLTPTIRSNSICWNLRQIPRNNSNFPFASTPIFYFYIPMRDFLRMLFPAILLLAFSGVPALAQNKIATVDLQKLFDNYYKTKLATAAVQERAD